MRNEHTPSAFLVPASVGAGQGVVLSLGGTSWVSVRAAGVLGTVVVMMAAATTLRVETERESDSRWIADVVGVPGAMAYGATRDEAIREAQALALDVLADELRHHDRDAGSVPLFTIVP